MMLMLLLTELTHLDVQLSAGPDGLHVQAPAGALADELRQAMAEHKARPCCAMRRIPLLRPLLVWAGSPALGGRPTLSTMARNMESDCATKSA